MTVNMKLIDDFLNAIFPLPERFGLITIGEDDNEFGLECEEFPVNYYMMKRAIKMIDPHAIINFGISKMAILSPKLENIVIKIPFNGYWESGKWIDFYFADAEDTADYCLSEFEKYNKLKENGLDCFVAKTSFYKSVNGTRVFLQERVIPLIDSVEKHNSSQKSKDLAKKIIINSNACYPINVNWLANCLDKYGQEKTQNFMYYCENEDSDIIDDLHLGNIGYRYDGTPCILDYSNYSE